MSGISPNVLQEEPQAASQVPPPPREQPMKQMSPIKQVASKYHARVTVGRRANTLRSVLRKLCGDIKEREPPPNQSNQRQAQPPPAAETAPENVAPSPKHPKQKHPNQPLSRRPSGRLSKQKTRARGSLEDSSPGPLQICVLSNHQKPTNPFNGSSPDSSPDNTPQDAPDQPSEHEPPGTDYNQGTRGAVLDQDHAQHQATCKLPSPSAVFALEETNTNDTPTVNIIDFANQPPSVNGHFTPTPTSSYSTATLIQSQTNYYDTTHPPTTVTASPPYPTLPVNHNNHDHNNHDPNHSHNHGPINHNTNNPNPNNHHHHNNNQSLPHPPPFTNLQYTSLRLALITDTVQLTPRGTSVRVNPRREALRRSPPEALPEALHP
ncbi:hypothetical protein B0I37DRAFT_133155 [Chaetomium sp. MPI-CAGE-AT-0009]|nr:hypothetical protein B0I37DRAFT_133155 [Chaetomium sp. MPI-CAGE-AT-0009]